MVLDAPVRPDQVSLGVLVAAVPRDVIDEAVAVCGVGAKRSDGKLPAHVTAYLTMGLALFSGEDYEEVAAKVTGSLDRWGCWNAAWDPPTSSAITQARKRLGRRVMVEVAERVFGPAAGEDPVIEAMTATGRSRGSWLGRWRLLAIDGFDLDVPDSEANAAEFGYAGSGENRSAFPKARVVAITECGTHAFIAAEVSAYSVGESTSAARLYPRLGPGELLSADRNFYSFTAWCAAADTGAELAWRAPTGLELPVVSVLADGTYLSVLIKPTLRGRRREAILADARAGTGLDPDLARLVRITEYDVPDRAGSGTAEVIVVLSTIIDPAAASAEALAFAYHQRWEHETGNDQLKTHLRGPAIVLRSRLPDLVHQEIWAYLIVHHSINVLIAEASAAADIDPDRISYTKTLRLIRRTATGTAGFPPCRLG